MLSHQASTDRSPHNVHFLSQLFSFPTILHHQTNTTLQAIGKSFLLPSNVRQPLLVADDTYNRKLESLTTGMKLVLHVSLKDTLRRTLLAITKLGAFFWLTMPTDASRQVANSRSDGPNDRLNMVCVFFSPPAQRFMMINFVIIYAGNYRLSFP